MNQSSIINLGLLLITAIGVGVTAWQAVDARHARDDARAARDAAQEHETVALRASADSASAAARSAEALEQRNAIELSKIATDPWSLSSIGSKYELRNISKDVMHVVSVDELGEGNDITLFEHDLQDVGPGESIYFDYSKTFASPASTTLHVSWGDPITGARTSWRRTLS
ncbi:hypothetical protein E3T25_08830 [Cryobacterium sandaracinum]|uniref:Secreted protein n=1 Tax=Cryobacterium sandaracinum TaxID=1259247 RepID=A0ABY2JES8_9MICO|nr:MULTISPECIES: hypothetical protein [Cryobacterium]TFC65926.1 hypothetical protein E3O54_11570 [Cryobacterium sp. TMT2-4]TFD02417.1 hypothetical protein E3T25_08830 [Cryobacterium sandaracinum]